MSDREPHLMLEWDLSRLEVTNESGRSILGDGVPGYQCRLVGKLPPSVTLGLFSKAPFSTPLVLPTCVSPGSNCDTNSSNTAIPSSHVRELSIERIGIEANFLGTGIWQLTNLVHLNLSRNHLEELDASIGRLCLLEYLDLSRNRLRALPKELGLVMRLKELRCHANMFWPPARSLPLESFGKLESLRLLDFRFNKKLKSASGLLRQHFPRTKIMLAGPAPGESTLTTSSSVRPPRPADLDATKLRAQLEPLSTPQLRRRLEEAFGVKTDPEQINREQVLELLVQQYEKAGPRKVRRMEGQLLDPIIANKLVNALNSVEWDNIDRERKKVQSAGYITLKRPPPEAPGSQRPKKTARLAAERLDRHLDLWNASVEAIQSIDPQFASTFSAIAVSKCFKGSPHVDSYDVDRQFAFSCGDFRTRGNDLSGCLCVESGTMEVAWIDTFMRVAKVDGRFPHWVAPYDGERFSVIWFRTDGEPVPPTSAVFE